MSILGELERYSVPHVHAVATRATSRVEIERLTLLMAVQDLAELAVTEHNAAAHKTVWTVTSHLLKALEQIRGERARAELANQLVIVDGKKLSRLIDAARDIERGDNLASGLGGIGSLFGETQVSERRRLAWFVCHGGFTEGLEDHR